ncbi:hypothetical protein [Streptomyces sp. NPDC057966]|uniref:hypothetical protein n=1 Tax=Streptomyces sp. NPDC057966 TaxID=3346292 RepID=UPI0036EE40D2
MAITMAPLVQVMTRAAEKRVLRTVRAMDADGWADNSAGGRMRTVPSSPPCAATGRPSRHE